MKRYDKPKFKITYNLNDNILSSSVPTEGEEWEKDSFIVDDWF